MILLIVLAPPNSTFDAEIRASPLPGWKPAGKVKLKNWKLLTPATEKRLDTFRVFPVKKSPAAKVEISGARPMRRVSGSFTLMVPPATFPLIVPPDKLTVLPVACLLYTSDAADD